MRRTAQAGPDDLWNHHNAQWRAPAQIVGQWSDADKVEPELLSYKARGAWWEVLAESGATLLVTREYEHLVIAMCVADGGTSTTYMRMPHPSGLAVDEARGIVYIASTRNPNLVYDLMPVTDTLNRADVQIGPPKDRPLVPVRTRFLPGSLYLHDLAVIGGALYANAVGQNAVVRLDDDGRYERVWWPRCIETSAGPVFGQNHIQLNSIAAGQDLRRSYFSASTDRISARRPGHKNFPVDKRGVIFSGATRDVIARGLTRPHSARFYKGRLWVNNSGYGEVGVIERGGFIPVASLPGWTRGLCFRGAVAFVGTSRVLPRFHQYAPGLNASASVCGVHAIEVRTGRILGSLIWPRGNQIFGVECVPGEFTAGFPFSARKARASARDKALFYAFVINHS
jgi:uncharacterized protein (TIGR03032 family)